jgi:hypothetical protein
LIDRNLRGPGKARFSNDGSAAFNDWYRALKRPSSLLHGGQIVGLTGQWRNALPTAAMGKSASVGKEIGRNDRS